MQDAIAVRGLQKRYGDTIAVEEITFAVAPGQVFGLLGPNGAGKTTTVECLLGLRRADAGEIALLGEMNGAQTPGVRARLGAQLQSTGLLAYLTVREQVQLFASLFPCSLPVKQVLARVGLEDKAGAATRALSGGQRQRLAFALALVNDPALIFLDEPTTGLDPQARRALWQVVRELKAAGRTVLLTTHYMEEAEQLCDCVAIVDHGRIIEMDAPAALIHKHFEETAIEFSVPSSVPCEHLQTLPGVSHSRFEGADGFPAMLDDGSVRQNHVTLYSTDVPATMAALFALMSSGIIQLRNMTVRQATLEDVFLKLTGRRIRE